MAGKSPVYGGRRAKAGTGCSEPLAGSRRGGPGAGDRAHPVGLDQRPHHRGLRGARRYGSVLAQRLHEGWGRGAEEIGRAGASSGQSRAGVGRGRGGSVWACGGLPELDAAPSRGRDRDARGPTHLALAALGRAASKGDVRWRRPRHTLKGRQDPDAVDRAGLRRKLLKAQAEAGDIGLLFADESEALTHPYLAHVWAKKGVDLRIPAPGQSAKVAMLGVLDWARRALIVRTSRTKRSSDFIALLEEIDRRYGPKLGVAIQPLVLVLDNGPIHTSKATRAALAARAHWLTVEWLPKYAPELNDIEVLWRDLKRHHLAHQTSHGHFGVKFMITASWVPPSVAVREGTVNLGWG